VTFTAARDGHPAYKCSCHLAIADVSQPRVSQAVKLLVASGAFTEDLVATEQLPVVYAHRYLPVLVRDETPAYGLGNLRSQAEAIGAGSVEWAVSGDIAADLVAPWRIPTLAVVYVAAGQRFVLPSSLVPAEGRADATVLIRPTVDRHLLQSMTIVDGLPLVSSVQIAADLLDLGGEDRIEAARRLFDTRRMVPR
jgi:hypothetical protein